MKVSVLVPARDAAKTIDAAIRSVLAQRFRDFELVLVDDGSRDETPVISRGYAARDPRVRVVAGVGEGIVGALNRGLAECQGVYVARFDADDLMHRDRLALQVAALDRDPSLAGVGSLVRCFPRPILRDGMRRYERWLNACVTPADLRAQRFVEAPLVHPSVTLRREALAAVDGFRDRPWPEDWDLWLRLLERGFELGKVPKTLHFWREGESRLTRTDARYSPEALTRARAHFLARGPLKERAAVLWGAGPVGKGLFKALRAEGATVAAFVDIDPRKIGQVVHGVPVEPPEGLARRRDAILLAAVGAEGARDEIRTAARQAGRVEGEDFYCCA